MTKNKKTIKRPARQKIRRLEGLSKKLFEFGELDDIQLAFIALDTKKDEVLSYLSSPDIPWLGRIEKMVRRKSL
jgi:hypothetical protein